MIAQEDFDALLANPAKEVRGDVIWTRHQGGAPAVSFRAEVHVDPPIPLRVIGRFNPGTRKLSFALIHGRAGRIYGLDLGATHRNPDKTILRGTHKHRWQENSGDRIAYRPNDITAEWDDPVSVWKQFCAEANLRHSGVLEHPFHPNRLPL